MSSTNLQRAVLALFVAFVCASANTFDFSGIGPKTPYPALFQAFHQYSVIRSDVHFDFLPSGTTAAIRAIQPAPVNATYDFAFSDTPLTSAQSQGSVPPNDIFQFPIFAIPVVLAYNLPGMMNEADTTLNLRLVLDRRTAADIFALRINHWRDPRIVALQNAAVAALLPNANITVIVRNDASAMNKNIQDAVVSFSTNSNNTSDWPWGAPATTWPAQYLAQPSVKSVYQVWGLTSASILTPYSITYINYPEIAINPQYKFAVMVNRHGDTVSQPSLLPSIESVVSTITSGGNPSITDSAAQGTWPIGFIEYVLIRKAQPKPADCRKRRELLLFFHWYIQSSASMESARDAGYTWLGDRALEYVHDSIDSVLQCPETGLALLASQALPQHESSSFVGLLAAGYICLGITVISVVTFLIRDRETITGSALFFYLVLFIGSILCFASIPFFYLIPDNDAVCRNRQWLATVGLSTMLSAVFCRGFQVYAVRQRSLAKNGLAKGRVNHTVIQVLGNLVLVGAQVIILAVWTGQDPFKSVPNEVSLERITFTYICSSESNWQWWGIEIAYTLLLLMFGLFVVYKTWDLKHMVKESKWMSISIYNTLVVLTLVIALFAEANATDDLVYWLAGGSVLFLSATMVIGLFMPRVLALSALAQLSNGSGTSSATDSHGGGGNRSHSGSQKRNTTVTVTIGTLERQSAVYSVEKSRIGSVDGTAKTTESAYESHHKPASSPKGQVWTSKMGPGKVGVAGSLTPRRDHRLRRKSEPSGSFKLSPETLQPADQSNGSASPSGQCVITVAAESPPGLGEIRSEMNSQN